MLYDEKKYTEIIKKMPPERKLEISFRVSSYARQEIYSFLRNLHPHMDNFELCKRVNQLLQIVEERQFE